MINYTEGYELQEDEYLLKIRPYRFDINEPPSGYLTKYTQKGTIPSNFSGWKGRDEPLQIYIFKEYFRSGWKLYNTRIGKSQQWCVLIHPEGFTIEIYLDNFIEIVKEVVMVDGVLIGNFKWKNNKLIKAT